MALHQRRRTMKRHSIEGVASPKPIQAEAPTVPSRAPVLTISPEAATITADDPGVQLLLRRQSADGTVRDLTGLAGWRVDPPGSAAIEAGGYLRPLAAGKVVVKAAIEGQEVVALINVEPRENRSWDFASDVVPILTRLGCNTGSCHGRADGQNGFHLSLSGYDPDGDYQRLVREGGQRRVALLDPEQSLFLTKATGRTPHGGGPRIAAAAPESGGLLRQGPAGGMGSGSMMGRPSLTINPKGQVIHLRTKQAAQPRLPGGEVVTVAAADDPRRAPARWITAPGNHYFARATANWVWAQPFGKGLADPPDDLSRSNPPVQSRTTRRPGSPLRGQKVRS